MPAHRKPGICKGIFGFVAGSCFFAVTAVAQTAGTGASGPALPQSGVASQPIDLPTTLRLAGANNIDLALIREALVQAEAQNDSATLGLLPSLAGGVGYSKHNGAIQDVNGNVIDVNKQLHTAAGGLSSQVNLGDAIFQKLSASRLQTAAEYTVDAGRNVTLYTAAAGYLDLVNAISNEKIADDAVRISKDYGTQVDRAVAIGLANKSDSLRVNVQTQNFALTLRQAQEAVVLASARLANILHVDPAMRFVPKDDMAPQITLIALDSRLDGLVSEALDKRPELKASVASLEAAGWQKTQSIYGPLIPSVGAQAVYGNISGGPLGAPSNSGGTQDYALMFNWRVGAGGLLDFSRIDYAQSKLEQARLNDAKLRDNVGRQVVQTYEAIHSAFDQLQLAKRNVELAEQSLQLSQGRKDFGVAAVLEVIQAQKDLIQARSSYVVALTAYAEGQYALAEAVGRISE